MAIGSAAVYNAVKMHALRFTLLLVLLVVPVATRAEMVEEIIGWLNDPSEMDEGLTNRAREELARERRRQAEEDLLRKLRERTVVKIHENRLPFRYLPEA